MSEETVFPLAFVLVVIALGCVFFYTGCDPEPCDANNPDCFNISCDTNSQITLTAFIPVLLIGTIIFMVWLWIEGVSVRKRTIANILEEITIPYVVMLFITTIFSLLIIAIVGFGRWMG